jgi:RNA polymerase sigma-70 factor (ECF subfamily)
MQTPSAPAQRRETASKPDARSLQQLRGAIHGFILGKVKDPALADDITQETLLRLHQRFDTLREADRLQAWVFQIARNAVADHYRSAKPTESFDEQTHAPPADPEPHGPIAAEEEALRHELAAYVRSVVESLPVIYRDALKLTEFEGNSQVELARRLGLSVSAAKSRVQRARAMVREEMERCCRWETDRYGNVVEAQAKVPSRCDCDGERKLSSPSP